MDFVEASVDFNLLLMVVDTEIEGDVRSSREGGQKTSHDRLMVAEGVACGRVFELEDAQEVTGPIRDGDCRDNKERREFRAELLEVV